LQKEQRKGYIREIGATSTIDLGRRRSLNAGRADHRVARKVNGVYSSLMDYSVGSPIRVRLYSGQIVDANITAIVSRSAGRKVHIAYGNATAIVNPAQIIEVVQAQPSNGAGKLTTSQRLREIAEDYRHLAADAHGKTDDLRSRNYNWLVKLAGKIAAKRAAQP
jgi:hypothetical protein